MNSFRQKRPVLNALPYTILKWVAMKKLDETFLYSCRFMALIGREGKYLSC